MDWWLIPVGIAVVVLLWYLWVAAFQSGETVSALPELEGYVPGESDLSRSETAQQDLPAVEPSAEVPPNDRAAGANAAETARPGEGESEGNESHDDDGIWIEIHIEPLFASSESRQIVELTEAEDPEVTP
jgi:hypothetical protein